MRYREEKTPRPLVLFETDGSPRISNANQIRVPNGSLTNIGNNVVSLNLGYQLASNDAMGNVDAGTDDNLVFSVPANLMNDLDFIEVFVFGRSVGAANKQFALRINGINGVITSTYTATGAWTLKGWLMRSGAALSTVGEILHTNGVGFFIADSFENPATFSNPITIHVRTIVTNANEIILDRARLVKWTSAP